jgi:pyrroline-5-carboxylate reductase
MRLGFIGTGRITTALVEGFCTHRDLQPTILVSPRNAEKASRLSLQFSQVEVAADNQDVVNRSDFVFLALLPPMASSILSELRFRADQTVVSVIALRRIQEVRELVRPAGRVFRAVPLPSVAMHQGPILYYPDDREVKDLFSSLGSPVPVSSERDLTVLWGVTALGAPFYALLEEILQWSIASGVERKTAQRYISTMFSALSAMASETSDLGFSGLITEAATPGGLNEQALAEIRGQGGFGAFLDALDSILLRLGEKAPRQR